MYDTQKTKIIATLGDPTPSKKGRFGTYVNGICDLDQRQIPSPTLQQVVDLFFHHGADVLRINLAHIEYKDLDVRFREIKKAILLAEKAYKRRIGVLVDLPGPKIRFHSDDWIVPTELLRLSFRTIKEELTFKPDDPKAEVASPKQSVAQINLDAKAFYKASAATANRIVSEIEESLTNRPADNPLLAFIGDNDCTLRVIKADIKNCAITCEIISIKNGNRLVGKNKGFTIRGISKPIGAFTEQDQKKLNRLLKIDYESYPEIETEGNETPNKERIISHIGISFCQKMEDVRQVAHYIVKHLKSNPRLLNHKLEDVLAEMPLLIAKIETEEGAVNVPKILDIADGVMIARGDLALEIETARLPEESKRIIDTCNLRGKPVIMATQMLESMKTNIECSRPEATDVFDAVVDGADALLLSGETSSGQFPGQAILKMRDLSCRAEKFLSAARTEDHRIEEYVHKLQESKQRVADWKDRWKQINCEYEQLAKNGHILPEIAEFVKELSEIKNSRLAGQNSTDRVSYAACIMSVEETKGIIAPTTSGRTARMLARFRGVVWIYAQPHSQLVARKLAANRGVKVNKIIPPQKDLDVLMEISKQALGTELSENVFIFTCGTPLGIVGTTNLIQRWDPNVAPD
jgi:pyruvate kinase